MVWRRLFRLVGCGDGQRGEPHRRHGRCCRLEDGIGRRLSRKGAALSLRGGLPRPFGGASETRGRIDSGLAPRSRGEEGERGAGRGDQQRGRGPDPSSLRRRRGGLRLGGRGSGRRHRPDHLGLIFEQAGRKHRLGASARSNPEDLRPRSLLVRRDPQLLHVELEPARRLESGRFRRRLDFLLLPAEREFFLDLRRPVQTSHVGRGFGRPGSPQRGEDRVEGSGELGSVGVASLWLLG